MILNLICAACIGLGVYLLLSRVWLKIILGLALLGHGANLFIFILPGLTLAKGSFVNPLTQVVEMPAADPVPQALILTAIVIGFGMQAFLLALFSLVAPQQGSNVDDLVE